MPYEFKALGKTVGIDLDLLATQREDEQIRLSGQGDQRIAQSAAPFQEITRNGRAFKIGTTAAVAAVVAVPTTGHALAIYNNSPTSVNRSLVIDWIAAQNVVSTAVASQAQMLVCVGQVEEAIPTDAALTVIKLNGSGGTGPDDSVRSILTATALPANTGVAANWFPWGKAASKPGVAATPGYGLWERVDGAIIIPPRRYFAMHVLANVVGETFVCFIGWHEKTLVNG